VGALLGTVTSRWSNHVYKHGLLVVIAAAGWGVGITGAGLSRWLWLTLLCLAFAGYCDMISGIFRSIIWNQTIPDHLRGRLAGIEMLSYTTGPLLGQVRSGAMARTPLGVSGSIWVGGVLCIVGTVALAAALPKFLRYHGREGLPRKIAEDEARATTSG
jgi:MFS family permease